MRRRPVILLALALGLLLGGGRAPAADTPTVPVTAIALHQGGGRFAVLWRLEPAAGWHLYADLRNDAGYPPALMADWPAGWSAGPLRWPAPERSVAAGEILDHVYEGSVTLVQEIRIPAGGLDRGPVAVEAAWDWLACRDLCVPGRTTTRVVFDAGAPTPQQARELANAVAALPVPAPADGVEAQWSDTSVRLVVPGAARLEFYPSIDCARLVDAIADGAADGGSLTLRLRSGAGGFGPLRGILHQVLSDGRSRGWTVDIPYGG